MHSQTSSQFLLLPVVGVSAATTSSTCHLVDTVVAAKRCPGSTPGVNMRQLWWAEVVHRLLSSALFYLPATSSQSGTGLVVSCLFSRRRQGLRLVLCIQPLAASLRRWTSLQPQPVSRVDLSALHHYPHPTSAHTFTIMHRLLPNQPHLFHPPPVSAPAQVGFRRNRSTEEQAAVTLYLFLQIWNSSVSQMFSSIAFWFHLDCLRGWILELDQTH